MPVWVCGTLGLIACAFMLIHRQVCGLLLSEVLIKAGMHEFLIN